MEYLMPSRTISTGNTVQPTQPAYITTIMRLIQETGNTDLNLLRLGKALELEISSPRQKKKKSILT